MAIIDFFDNEFRKRNKEHFASIVRVAMTDDVITNGERKFLDRLANRLNISEVDYKNILKDFMSYPIFHFNCVLFDIIFYLRNFQVVRNFFVIES